MKAPKFLPIAGTESKHYLLFDFEGEQLSRAIRPRFEGEQCDGKYLPHKLLYAVANCSCSILIVYSAPYYNLEILLLPFLRPLVQVQFVEDLHRLLPRVVGEHGQKFPRLLILRVVGRGAQFGGIRRQRPHRVVMVRVGEAWRRSCDHSRHEGWGDPEISTGRS